MNFKLKIPDHALTQECLMAIFFYLNTLFNIHAYSVILMIASVSYEQTVAFVSLCTKFYEMT